MRVRLWLALAALLSAFAVQPTAAFDAAWLVDRDATAKVVTDATAYNAITVVTSPCIVSAAIGGTCTFDIHNKATTGQNYTVNEESDPSGVVSEWRLGTAAYASTPATTTSEIAVGTSINLDAKVIGCAPCLGQTRSVYWTIDGKQAFVLDSRQTRYELQIRFS